MLTVAVTGYSVVTSLERYRALRSGWSWDLAYYNQWFWALTKGDGLITVRPMAAYADEGPSIWKMNYVAPIRLAIAPCYALFPGPETLLVVQSVMFWWLIPAAFTLVRSESGSDLVALAAAALVPATPLLWPLAWNDFREVQIALPFVLWAIQGYRARKPWLSALGIGTMLACRQEFAIVTASLAILPAKEPEDVGRTYRWSQAVLLIGACWMLFVFFGYLKWTVGSNAPARYVEQFGGPKAPLSQTLSTAAEFLALGLGSWAVLACFAPRAALVALPWLWGLSNGKWALRYLGTEHWHHVRYAAPMVVLVLAAGLLGWARVARWVARFPRRGIALCCAWLVAAGGLVAADRILFKQFSAYQPPISRSEAANVWHFVKLVGPDETVLAVYDVAAPLSSRRRLFSYVLEQNRPKGYPHLDPEFRWVFFRKDDLAREILIDQGFTPVYDGSFLTIFRRGPNPSPPEAEKKSRESANLPAPPAVEYRTKEGFSLRGGSLYRLTLGVWPGGTRNWS
jgi:hypothetical protein